MDRPDSRFHSDRPLQRSPVVEFVEFNARGIWEVPFWNLGARAGHRHLNRRNFASAVRQVPDLGGLGAG
jgi:hypothetical protein